jgi:hypothetical protein
MSEEILVSKDLETFFFVSNIFLWVFMWSLTMVNAYVRRMVRNFVCPGVI